MREIGWWAPVSNEFPLQECETFKCNMWLVWHQCVSLNRLSLSTTLVFASEEQDCRYMKESNLENEHFWTVIPCFPASKGVLQRLGSHRVHASRVSGPVLGQVQLNGSWRDVAFDPLCTAGLFRSPHWQPKSVSARHRCLQLPRSHHALGASACVWTCTESAQVHVRESCHK